MTQYLIIGKDGSDDKALERRMANREAHIALMKEYKEKGNFILGGAMLSEQGKMTGSSIIMQFETREELNSWLATDPYIVGKVWETYGVSLFKVAEV